MLSRYHSVLTTRNLYLFCLMAIAVGLSLSKAMVSMGQVGIGLVWLLDGELKQKILRFFNNKTALVLSSIYLLTLAGLIYTSNFDYAIDDLRRKLPLLVLPFCISGFKRISNKEFLLLFKVYVGGVLVASFWSVFVLFGGLDVVILDKRDLSRFNSHIRFGLEICLAIFGGVYYFIREASRLGKIKWVLVTLWLMSFLIILNLFTGIVILFISTLFILMFSGFTASNQKIKFSFITITLAFILGGCYWINSAIDQFYAKDVQPLELIEETVLGEKYQHNLFDSDFKENGYFIYKNIAIEELEQEWNKRSDIPFDSLDLKGQKLKHTLIRFITSKGQRKDAAAILDLSNEELKAIENGLANYKYLEMNGLSKRFNEIIWEYETYVNQGVVNGHSVAMRWVYWNTAYRIFKQHLVFGVGTGDLQDSFDLQYQKDQSPLLEKYRVRAHNQYITYAVSFGVVGAALFLFFLIYPLYKNRMYKNYFYLAFFSIILLSMLAEDTLETQIGITFFAFFNTIFLLKEKA